MMGIGANINIGRNVYSELPEGIQSRNINRSYDGLLRLGVKFFNVYLFAEGGLGQINGSDNFYNELTQSIEPHEWSKLNWFVSLRFGVFL